MSANRAHPKKANDARFAHESTHRIPAYASWIHSLQRGVIHPFLSELLRSCISNRTPSLLSRSNASRLIDFLAFFRAWIHSLQRGVIHPFLTKLGRFRTARLRGNILPLALVMTTAILLSGVTLGITVLESLRRSVETDDSMIAYYAADAGIEKQLYEVRKNNATITSLGSMSGSFSNSSSWVSADSNRFLTTTVKTFSSLSEGEFQFVDLYDPDQLNAAANIGKVTWTWSGGCQMELGYAEWDTASGVVIPNAFVIAVGIGGSGTQNLNAARAYRLRFRAKGCAASNLQVQVFPTSGSAVPVSFPGDITIASDGSYKRTKQAIAVTMPRLDVLSGVFSYVIFSECTLFKNPDGTMPACP